MSHHTAPKAAGKSASAFIDNADFIVDEWTKRIKSTNCNYHGLAHIAWGLQQKVV
jgi:hypothetical protein